LPDKKIIFLNSNCEKNNFLKALAMGSVRWYDRVIKRNMEVKNVNGSKWYVGVDIGTTSTKAVIFDKSGKAEFTCYREYPLHSPDSVTAEQNPEEIFQAVLAVIEEVLKQDKVKLDGIKLFSFSSAMHGLIALDKGGKPLTECLTWADKRAHEAAMTIKQHHEGQKIYERTGTPIHAMSPLAKLFWLKDSNPRIFESAHQFVGIKEYVFYRLFGEFIIDYSLASATGLFNLEQLTWDTSVLKLLGMTSDKLPQPVPTTHMLTTLKAEYREKWQMPEPIPFVIGASDGVLSNLGVNAVEPGVVAITIGTSGAIRAVTDKPVSDPKGRIFCYALTDKHWVIGGPVNNGGIILRWIRDELAPAEVETAKRLGIDSYDLLTEIAEKIAPGADGLIFHPYLAGERAPLWDSNARGSFFGLGLHHKKEHLIRAALEGVILNLYTVMLALQEIIGLPAKIQATGGFARSQMWRQMLADIFNQEVSVPESIESSCLGAVVLGMYALGEIEDFSMMADLVGSTHSHQPIEKNVMMYQELIPIYIHFSRLMEEEYSRIAEYQMKWVS